MTDIFTPEKRSEVMSKIRSKGTKIELKFRDRLEKENIYFLYQPNMFGHPDFFVPPNVAVFCDGSFWHGRDWEKLEHKLHVGYWREHISRNMERDAEVDTQLIVLGIKPIRFWDTEIEKDMDGCVSKLREAMASER